MQLTDAERSALAKIRKRQRAWGVVRWVLLAISILLLGLAIDGRREVSEATLLLSQNPQVDVSPALFHAMVRGEVANRVLLLVGFVMLVYTLVHWRGHAVDVLLLALLKEESSVSDVADGAT